MNIHHKLANQLDFTCFCKTILERICCSVILWSAPLHQFKKRSSCNKAIASMPHNCSFYKQAFNWKLLTTITSHTHLIVRFLENLPHPIRKKHFFNKQWTHICKYIHVFVVVCLKGRKIFVLHFFCDFWMLHHDHRCWLWYYRQKWLAGSILLR